MDNEETNSITAQQVARIAVYDDFLSAPRVVDIQPTATHEFIEQIASRTYELAQGQGGTIPYTVIREVSENFIHARFIEPTISILNRGNTIRFADQGPGIENKEKAQLPGFSSATSEMKEYIRGVGSGLPIVKEYLKFQNGRLIIEDNIKDGTVITITVNEGAQPQHPVVYQEMSNTQSEGYAPIANQAETPQRQRRAERKRRRPALSQRDLDVMELAADFGNVGATDLNRELDISTATAQRILDKLTDEGVLERTNNRKRRLTDFGFELLDEEE